jgi:hypothetical protein
MRTLRKTDIESMERELEVLENPEKYLGGAKGDWNDPYTEEEYEAMLASGTWTEGGFVSGVGYTLAETVVTGSASSGSGSNSNSDFNYLSDTGNSIYDDGNNPYSYNADDLATIATGLGQVFADGGLPAISNAIQIASVTYSFYNVYNSYQLWKDGQMSNNQFYIIMAENIAAATPAGPTVAITRPLREQFAAYMTEIERRTRNFMNGGYLYYYGY